MSKPVTPSKGLTWKHALVIMALGWLFASLVGGEAFKAGSIELTLPGCSMRAREIQRDVPGLPLRPAADRKKTE